jgi:hypothetical protein
MNPIELVLTAKKIAEGHVTSGIDLNDSILKVASDNNLSKPQIERLVEETNKATFMELLEKKGEQEFPVADYQTIKGKMIPKIEKNASENLQFENLNYSQDGFTELLGSERISKPTIEKVASTHGFSEEGLAYFEALYKVASDYLTDYNRLLDLEALGQKRYGNNYSEAKDLVKIAEIHNDKEILELKELQINLEKNGHVFEFISNKMEKIGAFSPWGNTNPFKANSIPHAVGAAINFATKHTIGLPFGLAGGAAKVGLKGAAVAAPVLLPLALKGVVKNPNASLTIASEGSKAIKGAKGVLKGNNFIGPGATLNDGLISTAMEKKALLEGAIPAMTALFKSPLAKVVSGALTVGSAASKLTKPVGQIGTGLTALASEGVNKEAGIGSGLQALLENVTPIVEFGAKSITPFGIMAGITALAAKKLGGGIALTMNKREFDRSFDTIMKNNPDFASNKDQVRGYFDVVSRHAPSLAKDPLVAESIVKNMNAFGGVDYNTVRGLRQTEQLGQDSNSRSLFN